MWVLDFLIEFEPCQSKQASQMVLVVKNPPAKAGDTGVTGLIPGLGRSPGEEHGNPLQYSCLENPYGQRSLVGYSPRGCKELDTSEWLNQARSSNWPKWLWNLGPSEATFHGFSLDSREGPSEMRCVCAVASSFRQVAGVR